MRVDANTQIHETSGTHKSKKPMTKLDAFGDGATDYGALLHSSASTKPTSCSMWCSDMSLVGPLTYTPNDADYRPWHQRAPTTLQA